jgi:nitric oxide reductase NorE protein
MLLESTLMNSTSTSPFISQISEDNIDDNLKSKRLPGDLAMWFFILAELTVFAIFFIGFAIAEQLNSEMFIVSKAKLHPIAGLINTIALITSSLFVALSVRAIHLGHVKKSINFLVLSQCIACIYLVVKIWEYQFLFGIGIDIETNTFFTLYFLITFFHFMHVLLGMVILVFIGINAKKGLYKEDIAGFESGACYWHMVDMLWIILFPLIYII